MRLCGRNLRWDFLERRLSRLCRSYALIVSDHPIPFIIAPVIITLISLGGWVYKDNYKDATELYTPRGAQSRLDQRLITDSFPAHDGTYLPGKLVDVRRECSAIVLAKDGGNILRHDVNKAVERLNDFIMEEVSIIDNGINYTYQNICMKSGQSCYNNPQIYSIPFKLATNDPYINLSYPTATYDNREKYYLGATLGGVALDPVSKRIVNATCWYLTYKLKDATEEENRVSMLFEREFERRLLEYDDPRIRVDFFHSQTMDLEVLRNADRLMPRFTIMFIMLMFFAVLCTMRWTRPSKSSSSSKYSFPVIDWTLSRPILAVLGVIGAGMGVATAIGLLSYVRYRYNNIVAVMPFLIVAVRLDNTFLMIAALDNTKRSMSVRDRISEAMAEAAVSITITVLTDMFSFAFGIFTDFLAVIIFSVYTTVAIIVTWIYQLTFLLGFLVLFARLEEKGKHCVIMCKDTVPLNECKSRSILTRMFCMGSQSNQSRQGSRVGEVEPDSIPRSESPVAKVDTSHAHFETPVSRFFYNYYGKILMRRETIIGILIFLAAFWSVSIYGCWNLRSGLEPIRLLVSDSYAIPYYRNLERYFWDYGQQVQVVIFNPGDLSNETVRKSISNVIDSFANLPHSTGKEGVDFWIPAFDRFLDQNLQYNLADLPPDEFYQQLNYFLFTFNDNLRYRLDVAFSNGTGPGNKETNPISAIRAMVGIQGFGSLSGQQETMDSFRSLARHHGSMNISVFHVMFLFVDQYEDIWPNVAQEIYCSMACMIVMSLLLIPHPICAIWVTFSILSIDVGVVGFMTLFGLNMDTISMITIIMSIGFSVDFSAHIAYAYVMNIQETPQMRVRKALGSLGWPVLQGGFATLLGVAFLANTESYMIMSFFITVSLVIIFGLLHGLVFLPVLLYLMMPTRLCGLQCIHPPKEHERTNQNGRGDTPRTDVVLKEGPRKERLAKIVHMLKKY